ncbi:MAG: ATP-binding protein, partial [Thermodesulfobacteriota bacterium]
LHIRDRLGNIFILVSEIHSPVSEQKLHLLKLLIETCSEVLESVRKQEQYLKNERVATIGQIAAGIIHELNNPLTGILVSMDLYAQNEKRLLDLLADYRVQTQAPDVPEELRRHFAGISERFDENSLRGKMADQRAMLLNGTRQVSGLMQNIRNFTKSGDRFEPRGYDLGEALENTLSLSRNALKYGIMVHRNWESPLWTRGDPGGLTQVFLNLVLNAVQAMEGRGDLWITGWKKEGRVVVSIRDSGPGMSPEVKAKIFDPFFTTKEDGTGLGLSIVKGIIERHQGTLRVDTAPGQGAVFTVELPSG